MSYSHEIYIGPYLLASKPYLIKSSQKVDIVCAKCDRSYGKHCEEFYCGHCGSALEQKRIDVERRISNDELDNDEMLYGAHNFQTYAIYIPNVRGWPGEIDCSSLTTKGVFDIPNDAQEVEAIVAFKMHFVDSIMLVNRSYQLVECNFGVISFRM